MPTDQEIAAFAKQMPAIYRDILMAFPVIDPGRKAGYGLAAQTIAMHFANTGKSHSVGDVLAACMAFATSGFVEVKNGFFIHPTALGERLIAAVTGKPAAPVAGVPPLPAPTW
jgi:hypothetical protein